MADAPGPIGPAGRDALYAHAAREYGGVLHRLARAYEADVDRRQELLQDIHIALWRSFATFNGRCSLRTWVYRVAHNVATSQVIRRRAHSPALVSLDELASTPDGQGGERSLHRHLALDRLYALVHALKPVDRQVILLHLEGVDAGSIGEITGLSSGNVATKVHRITQILARRFHEGGPHEQSGS
jgi:RNA polymerase sigma-70 factor (ECF subfamily)